MMAARDRQHRTRSSCCSTARRGRQRDRESLRGTTPLMWAAAYEHPAAVELLIERGADVGARSKAVPRGRRPYLAPTARAASKISSAASGRRARSSPGELERVGGRFRRRPSRQPSGSRSCCERALRHPEAAPGAVRNRRLRRRPTRRRRADATRAEHVGRRSRRSCSRRGKATSSRREASARRAAPTSISKPSTAGRALLDRNPEPLLPARDVPARAWRRSEPREQGRLDAALPRDGQPQYRRRRLSDAQAGHGPPRVSSSCCSTQGADVNARMQLEHRDAHDLHASVAVRGGRDAVPARRAVGRPRVDEAAARARRGSEDRHRRTATTPLMVASGIGWVEGVTYEWSQGADARGREAAARARRST